MNGKICVLLLACLSIFIVTQAADFRGAWRELPSERLNLKEFIDDVGLEDLTKMVILGVVWRSYQFITRNNTGYYFKTIVGPLYRHYNYFLVPNNYTTSIVDFAELGGELTTTCEIVGNKFMAYGSDPKTRQVQVVVKREIPLDNSELMIVTMTHYKATVPLISYFERRKRPIN